MISANEKVDHLASVKSKLESTLGELESSFDKEKKSRATVEKQKRKVEGDLKMAQDSVVELERSKRDLEVTIGNKRRTTLSWPPSWTMSRTWLPRLRRESRRSRAVLRPWRRNSRQSARLVQRPRGRDPIWRGRSTSWASVWTKPAVPPLLKWN